MILIILNIHKNKCNKEVASKKKKKRKRKLVVNVDILQIKIQHPGKHSTF